MVKTGVCRGGKRNMAGGSGEGRALGVRGLERKVFLCVLLESGWLV